MKLSPKPKAIIFDIDGTLLDSMKIWHTSANRYLESIGIHEEKDLGPRLFTATIFSAAEFIKKDYNLDKTEEQIQQEMLEVVRDFYRKEVQLKSGARDFLDQCKNDGIKMIVCTSGVKSVFWPAFERLDLTKYFEAYYESINKHEEENFQKILDENGLSKEEVVVFEDALHAGTTIKKMGIRLAAVFDEESSQNWEALKGLADYIIEDWRKI